MKIGDEMRNAYGTVRDRWLPVQGGVQDAIAIGFLVRAIVLNALSLNEDN